MFVALYPYIICDDLVKTDIFLLQRMKVTRTAVKNLLIVKKTVEIKNIQKKTAQKKMAMMRMKKVRSKTMK